MSQAPGGAPSSGMASRIERVIKIADETFSYVCQWAMGRSRPQKEEEKSRINKSV